MPEGPSDNGKQRIERLMGLVMDELRHLAAHALAQERRNHTLQPTELVNEAYLKLADQTDKVWQGKTHFFAVAASAVRQVLVDHARRHKAQKRGEGQRMKTLNDFDAINDDDSVDILALDEALTRLGQLNERQKQVVELRFFGGLKVEEVAEHLEISERTVKATWQVARAWLVSQMGGSTQ